MYRVWTTASHTKSGTLCCNCFSSNQSAAFSHPSLLKSTWPRSHCLFTLLLVYSVTKKARMCPHYVFIGHYCTAPHVRVVRRGRDRHLHGQVFLPPGIRIRHSQRCLAEHCPPPKRKAQFSKPVTACRFLACMVSLAHHFSIILPPCLMFVFVKKKKLSLGLHDESSTVLSHSSKYALCKVSPVGVHNTCSLTLRSTFSPSGFASASEALVSPRFRKLLDETVRTFAVLPSCLQHLDCDDKCMLSVPLSTSDRATFTTADGKVAESARCCPLGPSRCCATCSWYQGRFSHLFFTFVIISCSRICLLDVSRLLGLTLRPSALVCCCHQDFLTRGRLAFVQ